MSGDTLFDDAAAERLRRQAPLAARLRPRTIDDVVGQPHLLGPGKPLRRLVETDTMSSVLLWGPPGTGKTTLALAVAGSTSKEFEQLSAVTAGVKDVRDVIERARRRLGEHGRGTILFLDEIHRFNKAQQDALLPAVEDGTLTLIGATTENPFFEVNPPLRSRSTLFRLDPLDGASLRTLAQRGLEALQATAEPEAITLIVERAGGDGRQVLTSVEVAAALAHPGPIALADAEAALSTSAVRYGRDDHYDVISAFIKSMRGSDPDAAVYWLARMLEAGEDPRFIARRMVIFASEDVGMADPHALVVAVAAAHALEFVGLARSPAQPVPGGDPPGDSAEEQRQRDGGVDRPLGYRRRRTRRGSGPPARLPLPRRRGDRPWHGLRVSPRPRGRMGRAELPARQPRRPIVVPPDAARRAPDGDR